MGKTERLYNRYANLMFKVALDLTKDKQMAEDALQHTFVKVIKIVDKINEDNIKETGGLLILMCKQAVSELYKERARSVGTQAYDEYTEREAVSNEELWETLISKEPEQYMRSAPKWLKPEYLEPVIYRYVYEIDVPVIAQLLGLNVSTTYTRLRRAREQIKRYIIDHRGELD